MKNNITIFLILLSVAGCLKLDSSDTEQSVNLGPTTCMPVAPIIFSGDYVKEDDDSTVVSVIVKNESSDPCSARYSYSIALDSKSYYKHPTTKALLNIPMRILTIESKFCLATPCPPPPHPDGFSCSPACTKYEYSIEPISIYGVAPEIQVISSVSELEGIYSKK